MTHLVSSPESQVSFDRSRLFPSGFDTQEMMRRAAAQTQYEGSISNLSSMDIFMNGLRHIPILSPEEQQELAERYFEHQDMSAGQVLIWTNLRLVVKMARDYARRPSDMADLIQEGNVGLAEALTRYNPYRGVRFTGYARYWVRAMMFNYLMNHLHPVRLGGSRAARKLFYNLKKARRALTRMGEEPTAERIAEYLEVDVEEVVFVGVQLDRGPVFLDAPMSRHEETAATVGDMLESDWPCPEESALRFHFNDQIRGLIDEFGESLSEERLQAIWEERMTALDEPKQLAELGEEFQVSKERIRQLELELRDNFKHFLLRRLGPEVEELLNVA